jgi:hypothetical protein
VQARHEGVIALQQTRCCVQPIVLGLRLQYFSTDVFAAHARHSAVIALQQARVSSFGLISEHPLVLFAFLHIFSTVVCF